MVVLDLHASAVPPKEMLNTGAYGYVVVFCPFTTIVAVNAYFPGGNGFPMPPNACTFLAARRISVYGNRLSSDISLFRFTRAVILDRGKNEE